MKYEVIYKNNVYTLRTKAGMTLYYGNKYADLLKIMFQDLKNNTYIQKAA